MAAQGEKKSTMIKLRSSNGESFKIEEAMAMESQTIKHMIEDDCADNHTPLPNLDAKMLSKVIDYGKRHVEFTAKAMSEDTARASSTENSDNKGLKVWAAEFVNVDQAILFDLILAANYLNIKGLLDLTCQALADMIRDMIKDKTPQQIRDTFHIQNDFTPEEEAEVRRENAWAFNE